MQWLHYTCPPSREVLTRSHQLAAKRAKKEGKNDEKDQGKADDPKEDADKEEDQEQPTMKRPAARRQPRKEKENEKEKNEEKGEEESKEKDDKDEEKPKRGRGKAKAKGTPKRKTTPKRKARTVADAKEGKPRKTTKTDVEAPPKVTKRKHEKSKPGSEEEAPKTPEERIRKPLVQSDDEDDEGSYEQLPLSQQAREDSPDSHRSPSPIPKGRAGKRPQAKAALKKAALDPKEARIDKKKGNQAKEDEEDEEEEEEEPKETKPKKAKDDTKAKEKKETKATRQPKTKAQPKRKAKDTDADGEKPKRKRRRNNVEEAPEDTENLKDDGMKAALVQTLREIQTMTFDDLKDHLASKKLSIPNKMTSLNPYWSKTCSAVRLTILPSKPDVDNFAYKQGSWNVRMCAAFFSSLLLATHLHGNMRFLNAGFTKGVYRQQLMYSCQIISIKKMLYWLHMHTWTCLDTSAALLLKADWMEKQSEEELLKYEEPSSKLQFECSKIRLNAKRAIEELLGTKSK